MSTQPRQPAGTPAGGQFATTARSEPGLSLASGSPRRVTDRLVDELRETGAVTAHPGEGYTIRDAAHAAYVAAWVALDLGEQDEPDAPYVAAAQQALEETLIPDESARQWAGVDWYWTDDLDTVGSAMLDAVYAKRSAT